MSLRIGISFTHDLPKLAGQAGERIRRGAMRGAERFRARAKLEFRRETRAALGDRAANTWRDDLYPKGRTQSWHPAVTLWSKWPVPITAHAEGATILPKKGAYLVIPTRDVPFIRNRRMSMEEVAVRFGKLSVVASRRAPGHYLVFASAVRGRNNKKWRKATRRRRSQGREVLPVLMFTLVKQTVLRPRIPKPQDLADRLAPVFVEYVAAEIEKELAAN